MLRVADSEVVDAFMDAFMHLSLLRLSGCGRCLAPPRALSRVARDRVKTVALFLHVP